VTEAALEVDLRRRLVPPFGSDGGLLWFLGGDALGRPILARLIVGARTELVVGTGAVLLAGLVGSWAGLYAGHHGGSFDLVTMRIADLLLSFPSLLLALVVLYIFDSGVLPLILVLALTLTPVFFRVTRGATLEISSRQYIEAAVSSGARTSRLLFTSYLPMVGPHVVTIAMLQAAGVMLAVSGLSFLGIGLQPPAISWGIMVADGSDYLRNGWWVTVFPGAAIMLTALALNLIANWWRAAIDPAQVELVARSRRTGRQREGGKAASPADVASSEPGHVIGLEGVHVGFESRGVIVDKVDDLSIDVPRGGRLGIVGESGSGKTLTAHALAGVLRAPPAQVTGSVRLPSRVMPLEQWLKESTIREIRIGLIFQDALDILNPLRKVGDQVAEVVRNVAGLDQAASEERAVELLGEVRIASPASRAQDFPHQLSGGMRQRVSVAMALAAEPDLIIADEPTTALDVTVEAEVLQLLNDLVRKRGIGLVFITHDLRVAAEMTDQLIVMHRGRIVERGLTSEVLGWPSHPYTAMLLKATSSHPKRRGSMPFPRVHDEAAVGGCSYRDRCPYAIEICRTVTPTLVSVGGSGPHTSRCHRPDAVADEGIKEIRGLHG
jgi:peptide/nickel transport system permease protein